MAFLYNAPVRVIAVINQKGGVGKTTTVANLGAALAARGVRICLVDLDPQAHLTLHYGIEPGTPKSSVYDVLTAGTDIADATIAVRDNLWVVPSTIDLAAAEVELVSTVGREQILRDQLRADTPRPYDVVMIDCPPSLGLLTLNSLAAADEVVIPLQPHFLALQGLGKLLETVSLVKRRINPVLHVSGVVLCMYESNTKLSGEVLADLRTFFESARPTNAPWSATRIFDSVVRRNVKLAECPSYGTTIFDYEPGSRGAEDYAALADEFLAALKLPVHAADESPVEDAANASPVEADADASPVDEASKAEAVPADPAQEPPAATADEPHCDSQQVPPSSEAQRSLGGNPADNISSGDAPVIPAPACCEQAPTAFAAPDAQPT